MSETKLPLLEPDCTNRESTSSVTTGVAGSQITSKIVPHSKYPTHDSLYGEGGYKEVRSRLDMQKIPIFRLKKGTVCCVTGNSSTIDSYEYWQFDGTHWNRIPEWATKPYVDAAVEAEKQRSEATYAKKPNCGEYLTTCDGLTKELADEYYAPKSDCEEGYLTVCDAQDIYLTKVEADQLYLKKSDYIHYKYSLHPLDENPTDYPHEVTIYNPNLYCWTYDGEGNLLDGPTIVNTYIDLSPYVKFSDLDNDTPEEVIPDDPGPTPTPGRGYVIFYSTNFSNRGATTYGEEVNGYSYLFGNPQSSNQHSGVGKYVHNLNIALVMTEYNAKVGSKTLDQAKNEQKSQTSSWFVTDDLGDSSRVKLGYSSVTHHFNDVRINNTDPLRNLVSIYDNDEAFLAITKEYYPLDFNVTTPLIHATASILMTGRNGKGEPLTSDVTYSDDTGNSVIWDVEDNLEATYLLRLYSGIEAQVQGITRAIPLPVYTGNGTNVVKYVCVKGSLDDNGNVLTEDRYIDAQNNLVPYYDNGVIKPDWGKRDIINSWVNGYIKFAIGIHKDRNLDRNSYLTITGFRVLIKYGGSSNLFDQVYENDAPDWSYGEAAAGTTEGGIIKYMLI